MKNQIENVLRVTPISSVISEAEDLAGVEVPVGTEEIPRNVGGGEGVFVSVASGCGESDFRGKRKRGRPRKNPVDPQNEFMVVPPECSSAPPLKRGRGRPKGSGKWQTLAASLGTRSYGEGSAGRNLIPHIINLQPGENMAQTIWSFSQRTQDSICILSASGTLSRAEIQEPGSHGAVLTYQGWFDIVTLRGSHTYTSGQPGKNCLLSVQLLSSDGRIIGGAVAGSLIVAVPTLLVLATFREGSRHPPKTTNRVKPPQTIKPIVAAPLQTGNGKLPDTEANSPAPVPPDSAPPADEEEKVINAPDVNPASPPQAPIVDEDHDHQQAPPPADDEIMNGHDVIPDSHQQAPPPADDEIMNGHDVIPDSHQQAPPLDDEFMNGQDVIPASHQQAPPLDDDIMNGHDVIPDSHQQAPPLDEFMNGQDVIPASPDQHAEWNSSQPSALESELAISGADIRFTDE